MNDGLVVVERRDERVVLREVTQPGAGVLQLTSPENDEGDDEWAGRVLGAQMESPTCSDPVIADLANRFPGLRPYCDGSLFNGIVTAIIGQSVSLASAAAAQRKLAMAFHSGIEWRGRTFCPLPTAAQLAEASVDLIRESGITWKRAEGLQAIAREDVAGRLPTDEDARIASADVAQALLALPMVGNWTAQSVLLWGIGAPDAYPSGDVALLNAARRAYRRPSMTMSDLDALSEKWRPNRGIAARLLWANLFGTPQALPRTV